MKRLLIVGAAASALLATAAPALASDARVADGSLRITAAGGEANGILVMPADGAGLWVSDVGAVLQPGPGCAAGDDGATCTGAGAIAIALGDGDDSAALEPEVRVPALIDAGAGTDYVVGGGGNDTVAARDGAADSIACGPGRDRVSADPVDEVDSDCEDVTTSNPAGPTAPQSGAGSGTQSSDPAQPDAGSSPGSTAGGGAAVGERRGSTARCSRSRAVCSIRLIDTSLTGTVTSELRFGPVVFATGRGRIVKGVARVRMRARLPLVRGRYRLVLVVRAKGRHRPFSRSLVVILPGGKPA